MTKTNKIFLVVFVALLLLTVGEILYYFLSQRKVEPQKSTPPPVSQQQAINASLPSPSITPAIPDSMYPVLRRMDKHLLKTSVINNTYEGYVIDNTLYDPNNTKHMKVSDGVKRHIIDLAATPGGTATLTYVITDEQLNKKTTKFMQGNKTISLTDIKKGDKIRIQESLNILASDQRQSEISLEITKL